MKKSIYPCLWFNNNNASEAANYYCSVFSNTKVLQETPIVTTFKLNGTKCMGLNGGPKYKVNPAISFYVYCGNENEFMRIFNALSENGKVFMPLDKYEWSEKYAWVIDQFGVNWQLDIRDIQSEQKIVPSLLFVNEKALLLNDVLKQYTSIFENSTILLKTPYPENTNLPSGSLLFAQFRLNNFIFNAMSSTFNHKFDFTPANSFVIECENQEEIDYYWHKLGEGGHFDMCGWLTDRYGISWQIVPSILSTLMTDPKKGHRVIQAFLKMQKFDIETLLNA
jgi:predicted 3-demethylubiquinone-9 3-methyltransferase (glyoxalase superfamily)